MNYKGTLKRIMISNFNHIFIPINLFEFSYNIYYLQKYIKNKIEV